VSVSCTRRTPGPQQPQHPEKSLSPLPLYPLQFPRGLAWNLSQAFTVRGRQITAWGLIHPPLCFLHTERDITSLLNAWDVSSSTVSRHCPGYNLRVTVSQRLSETVPTIQCHNHDLYTLWRLSLCNAGYSIAFFFVPSLV